MVSPAPARNPQDKSKPAGQANDKVSQPRADRSGDAGYDANCHDLAGAFGQVLMDADPSLSMAARQFFRGASICNFTTHRLALAFRTQTCCVQRSE